METRKLIVLLGMVAALAATGQSRGADFDRGGVSVDFLAADRARRAAEPAAQAVLWRETLESTDPKTGLPPDWRRSFHLFSIHPDERADLVKRIEPLAAQTVSTGNGKRFLRLRTEPSAQDQRAAHTLESSPWKPDFCGAVYRWITLPGEGRVRRVRVRFSYRGEVADGMRGVNRLLVQGTTLDHPTNRGQAKKVDYRQQWFDRLDGGWHEGELNLLCTEEARQLGVYFKNYGCTTIDLADITAEELDLEEDGLSVFLTPQFFADNRYCLAAGEPSILKFTLLNEAGVDIGDPVLVLELPAEFEVADARLPMKFVAREEVSVDGRPRVRYRYALAGLKNYIRRTELNHYTAATLLLRSSLGPGDAVFPARYWVEDGSDVSRRRNFELRVIEPVRAERPKRFVTGAVVNREFDLQSDEARRALVDSYLATGFNSVHIGAAPRELMAMFGAKGVRRYTQPYWLVNGYRIGAGEKPDEARFQLVDGSYHERAICPVAVYKPGAYFRDQVEAPLRKLLVEDRVADSIMPNWEPYMFKFKGCFCPRCRAEFSRYAGIAEDRLAADWPRAVVEKHRQVWVRFRAWQHGELMKKLEETVGRIGREAGIEAHFIPEIATLSLSEEGRQVFEQVDPLQYVGALKTIESWGPYVDNYSYPGRYHYRTGDHLAMAMVSRKVPDYLARHLGKEARVPQLIGFPHASQGSFGMAEPEGIAFDTLCLFVNRWNGALAYHFPDGFDARYRNALARANRAITRFEDLLMDGTPRADHRIEALTPLPRLADSPSVRRHGLDRDASLLFSREFVRGDRRLVAIGNTWKYGGAFVRLSLEEVAGDGKFVLREPLAGRCFGDEAGGAALSAADLARGMTVQVGALRFGFFQIEPWRADGNYGRVVRPAEMAATLAAYRPGILKAIEFEKRYQGSSGK